MEPVTLRSWGACKLMGCIAMFAVVGAIWVTGGASDEPRSGRLSLVQVLALVAVAVLVAWRTVRIRVVLSTDEIVVENVVRRHRFQWSEIDWVEQRRTSDWEGTTWATVLHLRSGAEVVMLGYPEPHQWGRSRADEVMGRLCTRADVAFAVDRRRSAGRVIAPIDDLLRTTDPAPSGVPPPTSELRPLVNLLNDPSLVPPSDPWLPAPPAAPCPRPPVPPRRLLRRSDDVPSESPPARGVVGLVGGAQATMAALVVLGVVGAAGALAASERGPSWRTWDTVSAVAFLSGATLFVGLVALLAVLLRRARWTPGHLDVDSWNRMPLRTLAWWWLGAVGSSIALFATAIGLYPSDDLDLLDRTSVEQALLRASYLALAAGFLAGATAGVVGLAYVRRLMRRVAATAPCCPSGDVTPSVTNAT